MPHRLSSDRITRRALALGPIALVGPAEVSSVASRPRALPPGALIVDGVPTNACVTLYGPGSCREHGHTIDGSIGAIALWPMPDEDSPCLQTLAPRGRGSVAVRSTLKRSGLGLSPIERAVAQLARTRLPLGLPSDTAPRGPLPGHETGSAGRDRR